eukprot:bmy_12313T0
MSDLEPTNSLPTLVYLLILKILQQGSVHKHLTNQNLMAISIIYKRPQVCGLKDQLTEINEIMERKFKAAKCKQKLASWDLFSKSVQCLSDTRGWAKRERRFFRTADFLPPNLSSLKAKPSQGASKILDPFTKGD